MHMAAVKPMKRRGRPHTADPLIPVTTNLPSRDYDRLVRVALHRGESLSSLIRTLLTLRIGQRSTDFPSE